MTTTAASPRLLLVTGASRGIGAATAWRAAEAGWDVLVHAARDAQAAEAVAQGVRARGRTAHVRLADLRDDAQVRRLFLDIDALGTPLRGLVNNAGVVDRAARVDEGDADRVRRLFETNVFSAFACAREAVRRMSTRHGGPGGAIVNVSSVAAVLGGPGQYVDYAATKGAIDTFTVGLAREVATEGVRVNAVRPGVIDTGIHASGGQPDRAWRLAPTIPMQRPGSADEVAGTIVFLLSDAASYCTGALLDVGGGR